jgi:hypothetical protein
MIKRLKDGLWLLYQKLTGGQGEAERPPTDHSPQDLLKNGPPNHKSVKGRSPVEPTIPWQKTQAYHFSLQTWWTREQRRLHAPHCLLDHRTPARITQAHRQSLHVPATASKDLPPLEP